MHRLTYRTARSFDAVRFFVLLFVTSPAGYCTRRGQCSAPLPCGRSLSKLEFTRGSIAGKFGAGSSCMVVRKVRALKHIRAKYVRLIRLPNTFAETYLSESAFAKYVRNTRLMKICSSKMLLPKMFGCCLWMFQRWIFPVRRKRKGEEKG